MSSEVALEVESVLALRRSEQHFRSILEHISDTVTIIDAHGRIAYHSPSLERGLGLAADELTGCSFAELIHPDDAAAVRLFFATASESMTIDARIRHRDGSWRWFSMVATAREVAGERSLVVNGRDVTEKRLLLAQLEQEHRVNSLGRLAATVAHEFNNVLMAMQPFAELILRPGVDAATIQRGARSILNSIARGKRVSLDILRFTHPAHPMISVLELRAWWNRMSPELRTLAGAAELETWFPPRLAVLADAAQLTQVVANLISNARDAMPQGGRIDLIARRPERDETFAFGVVRDAHRFVQLSIADTGDGMAEDVVAHVFEPLFTTKLNGRTGLGLAVVHQIVLRHGGAIFVTSKPGEGTTFHLFLPAASTFDGFALPVDLPSLEGLRVLVIDDELPIASGLAELLKEFGATTEAATSMQEAIVTAELFTPDVAVIDVRLNDGDGFDLGARLRTQMPALRLVYVSGHADAQRVPEGESGTSFLQKPFDAAQLLDVITKLAL
ncbi:MAG TPA: ATP-binding protein [Thermoanaerobaculia bacterium]|nr:ATP-binding protein [Thermoanaerobaculia bacterium]